MAETLPLDYAPIKAAVKAQMEAVEGVGRVETKCGGSKAWLLDPRPARNHWEIHVRRSGPGLGASISASAYGGNSRFQNYEVQIEGFMPFSYENPDTTPIWDALLAAIGLRFVENATLGGRVWNAEQLGAPNHGFRTVPAQGVQTDLPEAGERLCHWVQLILVVETWFQFRTT